jgi:hypothetical protein
LAARPQDGTRCALNVSASALAHPAVRRVLTGDLSGLVLEVTENELVTAESATVDGLQELRRRGALVAVDDAGAGYASMRQVLALRPDLIKLDRTVVSGVDRDPAKAALVRAFVALGRDIGAQVCAEGIEELDELLALADLDVALGQGFHLARPAAEPAGVDPLAVAAVRAAQRAALDPATPGETTIDAVAAAIAGCSSYAELDEVLPAIERLLDVEHAYLSRVEEGADGPVVITCAGEAWREDPIYRLADFPATAAALDTGAAVQVVLGDEQDDPAERALLEAADLGSLLLVPLCCRDRAVGLLEIYRADQRAWSRRHIARARTVGHQLAMALAHLERR